MSNREYINAYNELVEAQKREKEANNNNKDNSAEMIEASQPIDSEFKIIPDIQLDNQQSENIKEVIKDEAIKDPDNEEKKEKSNRALEIENEFLRNQLFKKKEKAQRRSVMITILLIVSGLILLFSANYDKQIDPAPAPVSQPTDTSYINEIYEANKSAVVSVVNLKEITMGEFFNEPTSTDVQQGSGSGFVYKYENNQYYAITNYHVVEGGDALQVVVDNNTSEPLVIDAELLGGSKTYDIAVITFKTNYEINPVVIGDSDEIIVGEPVVAMGSPYGTEFQGSVTSGIISGPTRTFEDDEIELSYIQTDAAINSGNSGGPLFNVQGEVIGVNSMKIADGSTDNMAFAIPINDVMEVVEQIEISAEGEPTPTLY